MTTPSEPGAQATGSRRPAGIRLATPDDLAAVVELIRIGDARPYATENVERFIQRLDPAYSQAWIAVAADTPVAMSMYYRRTLRCGDLALTAGYWANLYIDPDFRDQMLYPRLPSAMFQVVKKGEIDFIYAMVRRQNLIEAHQRIGFAKIADIPVLIKPLRPAAFVAKYKELPSMVRPLTRPADALFAGYLSLRRPKPSPDLTVTTVAWDADELADVAELLTESAGDRVSQNWTTDTLRARYAVSLDGDPYHLIAVRKDNRIAAVAIYRLTNRDHNLRMGVVMDLAFRPDQSAAARIALVEVERRVYREGADALMYLDGLGSETRAITKRGGFFKAPEIFTLVLWPKKKVSEHSDWSNLDAWRLSFGDHDAF